MGRPATDFGANEDVAHAVFPPKVGDAHGAFPVRGRDLAGNGTIAESTVQLDCRHSSPYVGGGGLVDASGRLRRKGSIIRFVP